MDIFELEVGTKELSQIFNISTRQVQRLTVARILTPITESRPYRYKFESVCGEYIHYLEKKIAAQEAAEHLENLAIDKLRAEVKTKNAKAEIAEMELKELQGKFHRAEDVEAITTDYILYFRSMLMALPEKLAVDLAGNHTAPEQAERVKSEIYFILNQLADYQFDDEKYQNRLTESKNWEI